MDTHAARSCVLAVAVVSALARFATWALYRPLHAPDTTSYLDLARQILLSDFEGYDATRTLGYPMLLALLGLHSGWAAAIQLALGVAMSAMTAALVMQATRSVAWGAVVGLFVGLSPNMLLLEMTIMTEAISASLLVIAVYLLVRAETSDQTFLYMAAGVFFGIVISIRPVYVFLPVLVPALLGLSTWCSGRAGRPFLGRALAVGGPGLLIVAFMLLFNRQHMGHAMLTINANIGLANHAIDFAELSPDKEVADVIVFNRDTYLTVLLASRDNRASLGQWTYPELKQKLGLDHVGLSMRLRDFSVNLYAAHPVLYAKSVVRSWVDFWRVPLIYGPGSFRTPGMDRIYVAPWSAYKLAWVAASGVFLLGLLMPVAILRSTTALACYGIVMATSIVQALFESGENARYGIPTLPLIAIGCAITVHTAWCRWMVRQ